MPLSPATNDTQWARLTPGSGSLRKHLPPVQSSSGCGRIPDDRHLIPVSRVPSSDLGGPVTTLCHDRYRAEQYRSASNERCRAPVGLPFNEVSTADHQIEDTLSASASPQRLESGGKSVTTGTSSNGNSYSVSRLTHPIRPTRAAPAYRPVDLVSSAIHDRRHTTDEANNTCSRVWARTIRCRTPPRSSP